MLYGELLVVGAMKSEFKRCRMAAAMLRCRTRGGDNA